MPFSRPGYLTEKLALIKKDVNKKVILIGIMDGVTVHPAKGRQTEK